MNKQVMVVDDSAEMQNLVRTVLSAPAIDVHSTTDPIDGLVLAHLIRFDLILLDVDMPGMNGFEFMRQLKEEPGLSSTPVVFLTALGETDQKVRGLDLGAVDYLTKPIDPNELSARVRAALRTESAFHMLENASLIDSLTGLGNQRMFLSRMQAEISRRQRSAQSLACTYIDIDGFEQLNRTYGQPFADAVLKSVATAMRDTYRPEDVLCHLHSDDFAALLPDTSVLDAIAMARSFKQTLAATRFYHADNWVPITCGIAVASVDGAQNDCPANAAMEGLDCIADRKIDGIWIRRLQTQTEGMQ